MQTESESPDGKKPGEITSLRVLGARLTWLAFGPLALLATIWGIAARGRHWLTGLDAFFAVMVGLMILARWVEQRSGNATTLTGEPATLRQCKRYTVILPIVAALAWVAAKLLGNLVLA